MVSMESMVEGSGIETIKLRVTPALSELLRSHNRYMAGLSVWKQYLIWRYTLGSGQVNLSLIGVPNQENLVYWVFYFFKYYSYEQRWIEEPFRKYLMYFKSPKTFLQVPRPKQKTIINDVIGSYISAIQEIILSAPKLMSPVTVYKISSIYDPRLLDPVSNMYTVPQKPFNSTTYDPEFEFGYFLADNQPSVLWRIDIPKGSHILAVNPIYHAYPFEKEIILPHGVNFDVLDRTDTILEYIKKSELKLETVQKSPFVIGEVYRPLPYYQPPIHRMKIPLLHAIIR